MLEGVQFLASEKINFKFLPILPISWYGNSYTIHGGYKQNFEPFYLKNYTKK